MSRDPSFLKSSLSEFPEGKSNFHFSVKALKILQLSSFLGNIERQSGKFAWTNYCLGVLKELQERDLAPCERFRLIFSLPTYQLLLVAPVPHLSLQCVTLLQLAGKSLQLSNWPVSAEPPKINLSDYPAESWDQGTSAFGKKDHLVHVDCDKEIFSNLPIPSDTQVWIFNTGIKHDLVDSLYSTRHQECLDALKVGKKKYPEKNKLTDFTLDEIELLGLPDNLKKRAIHVCNEQTRVNQFKEGLASNLSPEDLGKLLVKSHESSSTYFENSC